MDPPSKLTIVLQNETVNGNANNTDKGIIDIHKTIQPGVMYFRGYRVEMDSAINALAQRFIYVSLPFLNGSNLTDQLSYQNCLVLPLDNAVVTLKTEMSDAVLINQQIPNRFEMKCLNRDGTAVDTGKVKSVALYFTYGSVNFN